MGVKVYVSGNVKYADWKNAFVDSRDKLGLTLVIAAAIIKTNIIKRWGFWGADGRLH